MNRHKGALVAFTFFIALICCSRNERGERTQIAIKDAWWPTFRGNARFSGIADDKLPDSLSLRWSFQTGSEVISSPVVGLGFVYICSTDGKAYALALSSGEKAWEYDCGEDVEAPPLLFNEIVYVGSLGGDFYALNALTGALKWSYKTGNSIYGSANYLEGANEGEGRVFVGSYDNKMYCFHAATGELIWTYETGSYINGGAATDGTRLVFGGCDERLHIVGVNDGRKEGEIWVKSYIAGSAALVDDCAYLGHYQEKLVCISIPEKKIIWEYENAEHGGPFFSSPAVAAHHVVIGSRDGYLHCVDRNSGEAVWTFPTRDEVDSSPVIAGDKVVAASTDGRVYLVDLKSGTEIWSYEIGAAIYSSPAVTGGMILIAAGDGRVYAFGDRQ